MSPTSCGNTGFHVAHAVVPLQSRSIPVRLANTSSEPVELLSSQQVAQLFPLVELRNISSAEQITCGAVSTEQLKYQMKAAADPSLTPTDRKKLGELLLGFSDVFNDSLGHINVVTHKIHTEDTAPIKQQPRRLPFAHSDEAQRQVQEMLEKDVIQPSTSAWSSPIVLVKKKTGDLRFASITGNSIRLPVMMHIRSPGSTTFWTPWATHSIFLL